MSASAILMMVFAIVVLWGGLGLAIININRHGSKLEEPHGRDL